LFAVFFRSATLLFLAGLAPFAARATSLPETYPMPEADPRPHPLDPSLAAWLEEHVERPLATELDAKEYQELAPRLDAVTRLYLDIARAARGKRVEETRQAIAAAVKHLNDPVETQKNETFTHPLVPFLYEEILKVDGAPPEARTAALVGLNKYGAGSCAQKDVLFEDLTKEKITSLSDDDLRELIDKLDAFRSPRYRSSSFRKLISQIPEARRDAVGDKLVMALAKNPATLNQFDWLKALARKLIARKDSKASQAVPPKSPFSEPYASIAEAKELAGKKQCAKAKTGLIAAVAGTKDLDSLDEAMKAGKEIDGCYKARDPGQRRQFWEAMAEPMEKSYGFAGWAEVKLRVGYIYWVVNDFNNAKPLFEAVRTASSKEKQPTYEARALYTLGRVAEDEEDREKAVAYFKEYVARFDAEENFEESMQALVLLHVDKREWKQAGAALDRLIQAQSALPTDKRSVSAMSFALFWAGRVKLEQGDVTFASEMWRRAASEYYSTYYGAISHYMLEKITGRILALQPARTPVFRMTALRQSFSPVDRQRVRRVEMLMRLGLRNEAACELDEVGTDDGNPEKLLVKALMLHASGHWLDAIKAYDTLPRSFRFGLPIGFERLVFPRRYAELIYKYAEKAKVDPDLVMAIIRQESVFNPSAKSPVGALGLMQLMPNTAKMEAAKLSADYVTPNEKKSLKQHATSPTTLTLAESNLAIGIHHVKSLLTKYGSPVYVLSAYNASPAAAQRWMNSIPTEDVLAFIERIPYKETRAYVKLVLRNYFYYKRWYGPPTNDLKHLDAVTSMLLVSVNQKSAKPNH
jgi:hypothetical protein